MRYVFIAGLEHSGTTLTDDLLSRRLGGVGLGEVGGFLSPQHMRQFLARWGSYPDARICSCGRPWTDCPFWGPLQPAWGLAGDLPREERYRRLLAQVRALYGDDALVVDSSKSLSALQFLLESRGALGLRREELSVVLALKDARSFAASVLRKRDAGRSLVAVARAFRWWRGANRAFLEALERSGVPYFTSLYEELCFAPEEQCVRIASRLGIPLPEAPPAGAPEAHIAIGNKDYLNHTRGTVRYDDRWFHDDRIQLVYLLIPGIRRFNRRLYLSRTAATQRDQPRA